MSVNRIIQVAGSNNLSKVKDIEGMKRELREHVVKVNEALRQLCQLVYTSGDSGGTASAPVVTTPSVVPTGTPEVDEPFKKHFMLLGE